MPNPLIETERRMLGDVYTSRSVLDNLELICDELGSRWGGTEGERQAAEHFARQFHGFGLENVRLEPFEYIGWRRGTASLRIVAPVERAIPCISLPMCPPARVHGPLLAVGDGSPSQFESAAERLPGAVAMVNATPPASGRTVHRSEKYQRTALAGAAAFLYAAQYPAYGPETGSIANDREALIPGISISYEDARLLQRLERRHGPLTLAIETTDRSEPMISWNVSAELPGQSGSDEWVLVGCHYDGHDISQGAHDPASGTVATVEAARVLAAHAADRTGCGIRFVLFGIEEIGLIGARRYVAQHADELDRVRFLLNLDAAGSPGPKGLVVNRWPALGPVLERWADEMAAELPIAQKTSAFSDHYPFFMAGVPTAMMGNPLGSNTGRGYDHSMFDTVDKVALTDLREAAAQAARLALRMSREEPWPLRRRTADEVAALVAAEPSLEGQAVSARMEALYASRA